MADSRGLWSGWVGRGFPDGRPLGVALATVTALVGSLLSVVLLESAASAASLSCVDIERDAATASTMAVACGRQVEDLSARSEWSQTFANPDGTRKLVQYVEPRWARQGDGSWAAVDTTLQVAGGVVVPGATVLPVTLSAGGDAPLARLADGDRELVVSWPQPLPAPVLDGDTATYPEVLPDVDLRVTANPVGFSQVLVVKTLQAAGNPALARVRFGLATRGLSVQPVPGGGLQARDANGKAVFASPQPLMWDSTGAPDTGKAMSAPAAAAGVQAAGAEPAPVARLPRIAAMPVQVDATHVSVTPDAAMLADPATRFPVFIDPSWTGYLESNVWKMVASRSDVVNSSTFALVNGATAGNAGAGRVCDYFSGSTCTSEQYLVRSIFRMQTGGAVGKHVLRATFNVTQKWAWTCSPASNAKVWLTAAVFTTTTWNTQPWWDGNYTAQAPASRRYNATGGCAGTGNVEFDVTHIMNYALASGWPNLHLGLRAVDENTINQWKRFDSSTVSLSIDYNSYPTVGARSTSPATACVTGSGTTPAENLPLINDSTPDLRVVTNDSDTETDLRGQFEWQQWSNSTLTWGPWITTESDPIGRANGGTSQMTPTLGTGIYRWRVRVADPWSYGASSGTDYSGMSSWCEFEIDATSPPVPGVTPLDGNYPDGCAPCGGVGTTGRFSLSAGASDVTGFWWGFSDPPNNWVPTTNGASQTIVWTPTSGGPRTLFVQSVDRANNRSGVKTDYDFTVDGADPMIAHWRLNEQLDDWGQVPPLTDATGNGHIATMLGGGTVGANGRVPGATAALFDGVDDQAATTGPVLADTSRSFSVSAWVRLDSKQDGSHTIVGQDGNNNSAFLLQYVKSATVDVWKITAPTSDDSVPAAYPGAQSANGAPKTGLWTHLAGVYDQSAKTLKLYVNGKLVQTASGVSTWDANGALRIGSNGWHGAVSDVRVWQRVLFDGEIKDLVESMEETKVGEYHFGEVDSRFALDSSNYGHTLNLSGGATIPASGAGYDGTGLLLMDGTGEAVGTAPSVFTSQSYTVSAWVRMDGASLPTRNYTAVGHAGSKVGAFNLGYRQDGGTPTWSFSVPGEDEELGGSGSVIVRSAPITTAVLGTWVHLQGTVDAETKEIQLYVNGALAASGTRSVPLWDASGALTVGAALWTPAGGPPEMTNHWVGAIDEVRVYAGVVPAAAGDWRFDSCTGTPVVCADGSSPAHPVTLSGDAAWTVDGYGEGSGLSVNGTGSAATSTWVVDTSKSFTVSAWVNLSDTAGNRCAVCTDGTRVGSFFLGYQKNSDRWAFWGHHSNSDNTTATVITSSTAPTLNTWTHLVGVYDVVNSRIQLYVNGQLVATATYTKGWQATGALVIGREKWNGSSGSFWKGALDDVRVYSGVITNPAFLMM